MKIHAVIPSKNNEPMLALNLQTLNSSMRNAKLLTDYSLTVIDNGSEIPYSKSLFLDPKHHFHRLDEPVNFSTACNIGAQYAVDSNFILFLNNDVFLHPQAIEEALNTAIQLDAVVCGTRLVYFNGDIQHIGVEFDAETGIPHHVSHFCKSITTSRIQRYWPSVTGAFFLVRANEFRELGGFDESYPFGFEDTDFCLRAGQLGYKVVCSQSVDSVHLSSASWNSTTADLMKESQDIFLRKWGGRIGGTLSKGVSE